MKKCLYLVGGCDKICACYTTTTDTWALFNPPAMNHMYGSAMVLRNKIYLCGGGNGNMLFSWPSTDTEEYNITEGKWSTSSLKLPKPLTFFTAAMVSFV